jgi:transposase InsO family protein
MMLVLRGLNWKTVLAYLDDVIVLGKTFQEHLDNLREVFTRMRQHNLKLKPKKCHLLKLEAEFLGRHISEDGVQMSPGKRDAIKQWPSPTSRKELESFIGYVNYHREFVPHFSQIAKPLHDLITTSRRNSDFEWTTVHQEAFEGLKYNLSSTPCLAFPTPDGQFILDTDASNTTIGAELLQIQDGKERTIAYASNALIPAQKNYCTTRKELLAVIKFCRQFRHYLLGRQFLLRTDHNSLAWLTRFRNPEGQLARWLEELAQYDLVILHRPGARHINADALSRIPDDLTPCKCFEAGEHLKDLPCGGCSFCARAQSQWERFTEFVDDVIPLAIKEIITGADPMQGEVKDPGEEGIAMNGTRSEAGSADEDENTANHPTVGYDESGTASSDENEVSTDLPNWTHQHSKEELRREQLEDSDIAKVINWLENRGPEPHELYLCSPAVKAMWLQRQQLHLVNGVMYYTWEDPPLTRELVVIPHAMREEVLRFAHDAKLSGHMGCGNTLARARHCCFWYGMSRDIRNYVLSCNLCSKYKGVTRRKTALRRYHAGYPMERVHLDILGPFTPSDNGNVYILSMIDQFSKWIEFAAIPEQTALIIAKEFVERFITTFGCPLSVHTDQGRQFESDLFQELCRMLEIAKTRTTPYHPASNGQVERYNRVLLQMIRCFVEDNVTGWDKDLPLLTMALHTMVHRQTGYSANQMMLGREVLLPLDLMMGTAEIPLHRKDPPIWVKELHERMSKIHRFAREHLHAAQARQKRDYDLRLKEESYQPGDLVYKLDERSKIGISKKLRAPWEGPFLVIGSRPPLYKLRMRKRDVLVHHDKLKPCRDRSIPLWLKRKRHEFFGSEATNGSDSEPCTTTDQPPNDSAAMNNKEHHQRGRRQKSKGPHRTPGQLAYDFLEPEDLPSLFAPPPASSRGRVLRAPRWMADYTE